MGRVDRSENRRRGCLGQLVLTRASLRGPRGTPAAPEALPMRSCSGQTPLQSDGAPALPVPPSPSLRRTTSSSRSTWLPSAVVWLGEPGEAFLRRPSTGLRVDCDGLRENLKAGRTVPWCDCDILHAVQPENIAVRG